MEKNVVVVKAKNSAEALELAAKELAVSTDKIEVKLTKAEKKFLGKVVEKAQYTCKVKEEESVSEEEVMLETDFSYEKKLEDVEKELSADADDTNISFVYTEEGVFMNVRYSSDEAKPITFDMVKRKIERKNLRDVNMDVVRMIVREKKTTGRIAEPQDEFKIDEGIEIRTSLDKMIGFVMFVPADGGEMLKYEELKSKIKELGITTGIDDEKLKAAFEEKKYGKEYRIAEGIPVVNGVDGKVTIVLDFEGEGKPEAVEDGYVDYYSLGKFISVKQGDVLAIYDKPTKGKDGRSVTGDFLRSTNGKGVKLPLGRNVMLSSTGTEIVAKVDGVVEYKNGSLNVDEVLIINGDVDLSTGNVQFDKNIKIRGSVRPRMEVKAGGSIEVDGIVDSATLEAGGKIHIHGGVQGGGRGKLTAGDEIKAQYIENAIVYADGDINSGSIVNSKVECAGFVSVKGQKASIIGGTVKSMYGIDCQNSGSGSNIETNLEVGVLPKLKSRAQALEKEVASLSKETRELKKVENLKDSTLNLKQKVIKSKMLAEYKEKYAILNQKVDELDTIRSMMSENKESYISVADIANVGTNITINSAQIRLDSKCMATTFKIEDGEIVYARYTPRKREKKDKK